MGVIQCGMFTGSTTVITGWEPQYITFRRVDSTGDWITIDNMRGCAVGGVDAILNSNLSSAETSSDYIDFTATGFISKGLTGNHIYTVIRRPNKPPTSGTQVYNAIARTGTGAAATVTGVGFAPDLALIKARIPSDSPITNSIVVDKLRGALRSLNPVLTDAENNFDVQSFSQTGVDISSNMNQGGSTYINHFFRRAPGFMDICCYTGTGVAHTEAHGLGVVPELWIIKNRSAASNWAVGCSMLPVDDYLYLNLPNGKFTAASGNGLWPINPSNNLISVGNAASVNGNGNGVVAYLFASKPGISKVFSYTGNGGSVNTAGTGQTINCGFTAGARFVLLKCSSNSSDWVVVDTVRGLVAGNDPALSLNTTAAEVTTTDICDPDASGFIVNQLASGTTSANFNVTGYTYIGLAIA